MLLLPVVDQYTGLLTTKLLMYDGKRWWTSQQDQPLTFIASQEINSVLTAWGTDGTTIFPLFQQPSQGFQKVIQSKLFSGPGYFTTKTATRLTGVIRTYSIDQPITITIDNELANGTLNAATSLTPTRTVNVFNQSGTLILTKNGSNVTIPVVGEGLVVFGPYPVAQEGRMIGMTMVTSASDMALLSLNVAAQQPYTVNL
jgi:hypothetical protein